MGFDDDAVQSGVGAQTLHIASISPKAERTAWPMDKPSRSR